MNHYTGYTSPSQESYLISIVLQNGYPPSFMEGAPSLTKVDWGFHGFN